jgi:hypothetical protein
MKKLVFGIAAAALVLGSLACGGSNKEAESASEPEAAEEGSGKKSLEKFEGNRMEKAAEEE